MHWLIALTSLALLMQRQLTRLKDLSSSSSSPSLATSPSPASLPATNPVNSSSVPFSSSSTVSSARALPTSVVHSAQHVVAPQQFPLPIEVAPFVAPTSHSTSAHLPADLPKFQSEKLSGDVYTYLVRF